MVIKGYGRRILFLFFCHTVHGFQGSSQTVNSADDADHYADDHYPDTPIKAVMQPNTQPNKAAQRKRYANSQLGQPYDQAQVFHIAASMPVIFASSKAKSPPNYSTVYITTHPRKTQVDFIVPFVFLFWFLPHLNRADNADGKNILIRKDSLYSALLSPKSGKRL
jgi:hypothetical protein